jgi:hypothetical protein
MLAKMPSRRSSVGLGEGMVRVRDDVNELLVRLRLVPIDVKIPGRGWQLHLGVLKLRSDFHLAAETRSAAVVTEWHE